MIGATRLNLVSQNGLIILGLALGFAAAPLVINQSWVVTVGISLAIPLAVLFVRYPFLGLSLWLMLAPFLTTTVTVQERRAYWIIHRALPPLMLALIALGLRSRGGKPRQAAVGWPEVLMGGYVLLSMLSILLRNSDPLATTYLFYDRVFSPMCLYMAIRLWRPAEKDLRHLVPIVSVLAVTQSLLGILYWINPQHLPSSWVRDVGRATGSLHHPNVYAVALLFCAGILLHAAAAVKRPMTRIFFGGATALAFLGVFLSFSRAAWLATVLVLAGLVRLYPRQITRLALFALPAVLVLGGLYLSEVAESASQRLYSDVSERSALSRLPTYLAGIQMFAARPLTGWGYGNFDRYSPRFQERVGGIPDDNKFHSSHHAYLKLLAEQGLVGLALFLGPAVWWLLKKPRSKAAPRDLSRHKLLGVLWLSMLSHFVVNNFSNMQIVFGLGLWWATLGLIASLTDFEDVPAHPGETATSATTDLPTQTS